MRIAKSEQQIAVHWVPFDPLPSSETALCTHRICSRTRQKKPHFIPTHLPHFLADPQTCLFVTSYVLKHIFKSWHHKESQLPSEEG